MSSPKYTAHLFAHSLQKTAQAAQSDPQLLPAVKAGLVVLKRICTGWLDLPTRIVQVPRRDNTADVPGCKALLLEVIRRASHDWVLYRTSGVMAKRKLAEDAYVWLFQEEPGHGAWAERAANRKDFTSFLSICELLDLDPEAVRKRVRSLTVQQVLSVGRPAEYRRPDTSADEGRYNLGPYSDKLLATTLEGIEEFDPLVE